MSEWLDRIGRYIVQSFSIDSRTLAVFRIGIGLLVIGDVLARASTFTFFYTEDGVVPQELAEARTVDGAFSFFFYTQDSWVIALLFVVHFLIAIQLILGYKTRFAMILTFLFAISLDHHNPLILSHADTLFRLLCFWAIFVPLGERWSIDSFQRKEEPRTMIASLGTAALLLQMVYMYTVNGFHKLGSEMWNSREATPLIFGLDDMTYFLAGPMRQFPFVLEILGTMWYYLLVISVLLLILHGRPRYILALLIFGAHFSFTVTVRIGAFGWVGMTGVLLFLPARFWDDVSAIARRLNLWDRAVVPVYDGLYAFGDRCARALPSLRPNLGVPSVVRDGAFDVGMTFLILSLFVLPAIWFMDDQDAINWEQSSLEQSIEDNFRKIGVRQSPWTVFAPTPRTTDRWYVFAASTTDGEFLDVYNDRPFSFDRPYDELQNIYGNYRERFYMNTIRRAGQAGTPPDYLVNYICRDYAEQGIELMQIEMYVIHETVTRETIDDWQNRNTWSELMSRHACPGHAVEELDLPSDPP
ncbi:MAG: HTTM domain-containing protein [Sphaerobacteraceae bacterium]|nr:MAG: HTTM domain-containing protein [Sphaerobacteraceae bacterium]